MQESDVPQNEIDVVSGVRGIRATANAAMVNRVHRIVRERSNAIRERRSRIRSVLLPGAIFSSLLIGVSIAVWTVFEEYESLAGGSQVASYQVLVPLVWSIPVSAALLAVIWFRQSRADAPR